MGLPRKRRRTCLHSFCGRMITSIVLLGNYTFKTSIESTVSRNRATACRKWYEKRRATNGCTRCKNKAVPDRSLCESCFEVSRREAKQQRRIRKANGVCRSCNNPVSGRSRVFCVDHAEQIAARVEQRESLTSEERSALFAKQNGMCPICEKALDPSTYVVDHNHSTGKIRGLLHRHCNGTTLRIVENHFDAVERSIQYLQTDGVS